PIYHHLINSGSTDGQISPTVSTDKVLECVTQAHVSNLQQAVPIFNASMVGASSCIMAVLAAFRMMNPNAELMLMFMRIPIKVKYFIPGIILLDLISGVTGQSCFSPSNTAYMAHVGGALTGFFIMWYWKKNQFNRNRWY